MRKITVAARSILGLIFFGAGVSFFLSTPPPLEGAMGEFFRGLMASHYFLNLLKITEITCGLMLLSGFYVPLALIVLAPIVLNIFLVHLFLMPSGLPLAVILGVLEAFLAFFSPEFSPKIKALFRKN